MRIIAKKILRGFWELHPECEQPLRSWYKETSKAHWKNPSEIKTAYAHASILRNGRIVFNIKGNKYRLIVKVNYELGLVWIRFIGTHSQYDNIDALNI
jgi:mRNA interferase HigB